MKKYWEAFNEIENCSEEYASATFKTGLPVRGALQKSLNMNLVEIVAKMMERIAQNARVDDEILCEEGKLEVTRQDSPPKKMDKLEPKNV